jgi:hydroxypyruvate reductase
MIAGGETTVTIKGEGLGGRNLEVALGAAMAMDGLERVAFISLATDGEDGPTDAAGAVVTGATLAKARKLGLDAHDYLERNDSYHFFEKLGGLIKLGPTGTNVNDLYFLIAY